MNIFIFRLFISLHLPQLLSLLDCTIATRVTGRLSFSFVAPTFLVLGRRFELLPEA